MELVENPLVCNAIRAAAGEQAFHAYIVSGRPGTGRHTAVRMLCQALECTDPNRIRLGPCGSCLPCRKVLRGIHPDVRTVAMEGKESFLVSQSREIRDDAVKLPNEGRHKVYVLPDADKMNAAAANALLKILEEPPAYAVFLLLTENAASLPETVRSRCMELRMRPVSEAAGVDYIQKQRPELAPEVIAEALADAGGRIGAALALLDGAEKQGPAEDAARALMQGDEYGLLASLMSLGRRPKTEVADAFARLAELLGTAACAGSHRSDCRISPSGLFRAARTARELRDGARLFISQGNYLAAAAAKLTEAAGEVS